MLVIFISLLILITAAIHIRAEVNIDRTQIYIFKPLTTGLIILLACLAGMSDSSNGFSNSYYAWFIVAGLVFSLFGDVFLIEEKGFLPGLVSFLIGHLFYIGAFTYHMPNISYLPSLLPFLLFGALVLAYIYSGLNKLKIPVIAYLLVIVTMGWQSLNHWLATDSLLALTAVIGASLFMLSDSLIAIDKFKTPLKHARVWIMSTYYSGQWLIALSIAGLSIAGL